MGKVSRIRIWSSHVSSEEFLLLFFLCDYIKGKEISVCFADEFSEDTWSISCMLEEEVKALSLKEHVLTDSQIATYKTIWKKAFEENSDIRYMKDGEVLSASFDFFTDSLLEIVSSFQEVSVRHLVGDLMGNQFLPSFGSFEYCYILERLIENGNLEVVKDGKNFDNVKYFGSDPFSYSVIRVKNT